MKNRKIIYAIAFFLITLQTNAQVVNINPDPNGEPWWSGDGVLLSPEEEALIPELILTPESAATLLPDEVYNNEFIYFPPIFHQRGASCVQAAEIGYTFTYEINRLRNVAAGDWDYENNRENLYYHLFTYNFLNQGSSVSYTDYKSGFKIIKENGCPMYSTYDDPALHPPSNDEFKYWMTDYNKYASGMQNGITGYSNIFFNTNYSSLDNLKHWIADHNAGEETGGLAIISVFTGGWITNKKLPLGTPHEDEFLITQLGTIPGTGHALTIVGYDDNVKYDFNGDGQYTTDLDINDDGEFNLLDREIGAFKIANSWGQWKNSGFIWLPYKVMPGQLQGVDLAYVCHAIDNYEPQITIKSSVEYPCREKLTYKVGYAQNANQTLPVEFTNYFSFSEQGGCYDMQGAYTGSIEVGLDFGYWYMGEDFGKIFFIIEEDEAYPSTGGTIDYFSIIDYRWGEEFELECDATNGSSVNIVNNAETILSVDYDLIPHESDITENLSLFSNMVSRFSPTVDNNKVLTVEEGVKIDMYNSELIIEEGSSLIIENNAVIHAKRGVSKIIVWGNIQIGTGVTFTADEGSAIELYIGNQPLNITDCNFHNCIIESYANPLTITESDFSNSFIDQTIWSFDISESIFDNSSVIASNPTMGPGQIDNSATITDCNFTTAYNGANSMIEVYAYKNFEISGNTINNINNPESTYHGISVHFSGSTGERNIHEIANNEIYCDNGFCDNNLAGITIYAGIADIKNNYIHSNKVGVQCLNNSQVYIIGNQDAVNESQTQRIKNNSIYQVYASSYAFPLEMHWNAIYSSNTSDCYIFHDISLSGTPSDVDVTYNYWGPVFDADINLCPLDHYIYDPVWELNGDEHTKSGAQQLFANAREQIADSNYVAAKSTLQQVITSYPQEEPATYALKEILYLEPLAGNDFSGLKNWYLSEAAILNHDQLLNLSQTLANKCDEKLENYPDAIQQYENIIEDPETLEDSIFAIIDLEHLYWQMGIDTNLRSNTYIGRLSQFKPKSFKAFKDHKDQLLALLLSGDSNASNDEDKDEFSPLEPNKLLQNVPNPFSNKTAIYFNLYTNNIVTVEIKIYDHVGKEVRQISVQTLKEGRNIAELNMQDVPSGIYYYSLFINKKRTDTKKMIIVK